MRLKSPLFILAASFKKRYYCRLSSTWNPLKMIENNSELGKKSTYNAHYDPSCLFPVPRAGKRLEIGIDPDNTPFYGFDIWNHYEVSWLNEKGKPVVSLAEIIYDCSSPNIVESKSLKLYFNSLNNTVFKDSSCVEQTIQKDLSVCVGANVTVSIRHLTQENDLSIKAGFEGESLDALDVACSVYRVEPGFLSTNSNIVEEVLCSDLLKSNCLVTHQPDWGSVQITYKGPKIDREGLLKYIISFRNHNEFHEQCIERIFIDIMNRCNPEQLTVYGRYTRRGGLDINPYRTTLQKTPEKTNFRLIRQ